jgi:hypothetical protein
LKHYQQLTQDLDSKFYAFNIVSIPRMQNPSADPLENIASRLIPPEHFSPDRFSMELIFRPCVLDNITTWHVFNDDVDIFNFLSSKGTYENDIIDEESHNHELKKYPTDDKIKSENIIPKSVVNLEDFYDLKDRFKKPTNFKTNSPTMNIELINLCAKQNRQNVNLGLGCSPFERMTFIKLFKKYKDVFSWSYDDLKSFDTYIIQHTIPILSEEKPVQQNLRKIHPNLKS